MRHLSPRTDSARQTPCQRASVLGKKHHQTQTRTVRLWPANCHLVLDTQQRRLTRFHRCENQVLLILPVLVLTWPSLRSWNNRIRLVTYNQGTSQCSDTDSGNSNVRAKLPCQLKYFPFKAKVHLYLWLTDTYWSKEKSLLKSCSWKQSHTAYPGTTRALKVGPPSQLKQGNRISVYRSRWVWTDTTRPPGHREAELP